MPMHADVHVPPIGRQALHDHWPTGPARTLADRPCNHPDEHTRTVASEARRYDERDNDTRRLYRQHTDETTETEEIR